MAGEKPCWLRGLLEEETFLSSCESETHAGTNNKYCIRCCTAFCLRCQPSHASHPILKVRRNIGNICVEMRQLEVLIDCSHITSPQYGIHGNVIYLKAMPQMIQMEVTRRWLNSCATCNKNLGRPSKYCSLACKVDHVVVQGMEISSILRQFNQSDLATSSDNMIDDEASS